MLTCSKASTTNIGHARISIKLASPVLVVDQVRFWQTSCRNLQNHFMRYHFSWLARHVSIVEWSSVKVWSMFHHRGHPSHGLCLMCISWFNCQWRVCDWNLVLGNAQAPSGKFQIGDAGLFHCAGNTCHLSCDFFLRCRLSRSVTVHELCQVFYVKWDLPCVTCHVLSCVKLKHVTSYCSAWPQFPEDWVQEHPGSHSVAERTIWGPRHCRLTWTRVSGNL